MARVNVQVRDVPHHRGQQVAWCHEPGCPWVYVNISKTDVQQQATWHRQKHRAEAARG